MCLSANVSFVYTYRWTINIFNTSMLQVDEQIEIDNPWSGRLHCWWSFMFQCVLIDVFAADIWNELSGWCSDVKVGISLFFLSLRKKKCIFFYHRQTTSHCGERAKRVRSYLQFGSTKWNITLYGNQLKLDVSEERWRIRSLFRCFIAFGFFLNDKKHDTKHQWGIRKAFFGHKKKTMKSHPLCQQFEFVRFYQLELVEHCNAIYI